MFNDDKNSIWIYSQEMAEHRHLTEANDIIIRINQYLLNHGKCYVDGQKDFLKCTR